MNRRASLLCLLCLLIGGCSSIEGVFESKKVDYKSAGKLPPLEIPPDLSTPGRDDRYAVPDIDNTKGSATLSTYQLGGPTRTPASQDLLPQIDKMHIERAGTQRWLVVPGAPEKVWPLVRQFWQELGFIVSVERPEAGVIETDWAENRAKIPQDIIRNTIGQVFSDVYSTPERDKFRTRIEPGIEPGTTEIYVSHRGMYEVYITEGKDQTRWEPRPPDPDLEAEMLRRLMVRLGAEDTKAQTMLASTEQAPAQAQLKTSDGGGALIVQEPFDRAWRRVGLALDRVGFTVEDRDRTQGMYFVRYIDPDADAKKKDEGGWLSKLEFWKSSDKPGQIDSSNRYRVSLKGDGETTTVQVLSREGGVDKSDTSKRILGLLFDQLK